jgi:hypothetical protein
MYQSSTRNNFLDILLDPTAIAILGSIALHAIIAASFPFLFQPEKPGKKADTGSVKVVQLTPNELQRIPQAPPPVIPQTLPPVYQPSIPVAPSAPPRAPKISAAPQTIPSSPIRTTPKTTLKPSPVIKGQKAKPQVQPSPPAFDPNISFEPNPIPSQAPAKPDPTKPAPQASQAPLKPTKPTSPKPSQSPMDDDNAGEQPQPQARPATPGKTSQQPPATTPPNGSTNGTSGNQNPSTQPSGNAGNANSGGPYGAYTQSANQKIQEYLTKYKDLKLYPPKALAIKYPPGVTCSKVKQPPFIVLMVAFDKIPPGQDSNVLGSATAPLLENEKPYIDGDPATKGNKKLLELATDAGFTDATAADQKRPEADKGRPVLYQYRVQLDPASCPN